MAKDMVLNSTNYITYITDKLMNGLTLKGQTLGVTMKKSTTKDAKIYTTMKNY